MQYHPLAGRGTHIGWTCCSGVDRDSLGCCTARHLPDANSAVQHEISCSLVPSAPSASESAQELIRLADMERKRQDERERKTAELQRAQEVEDKLARDEHRGWKVVIHNLSEFDTLTGLALKYNVTVLALIFMCCFCFLKSHVFLWSVFQELAILKENGMIGSSSQLFKHKTIRIPHQPEDAVPLDNPLQLTEEQKRVRAIDFFVDAVKCPREEARYYLECRDFVFVEALRDWQRDKKWEERQFAIAKK